MQEKLIKSVRAAIELDEDQMFNTVLTDKGLQKWILDLNRSQLFKGENSLGVELKDIGGGYSFTTEFLNDGKSFTFLGGSKTKKQGESPFLLDTGEYYNSYTLKLGNGFAIIDSNPQKDGNNLEDDWGSNLEGLNNENLKLLIDVIREKFTKEVRKKLAA
jgi:hypothetical protein